MKLLQDRTGHMVEIKLSDGSELEGRIGEVSTNPASTAFELEVVEEFEDGTSEQAMYVINWSDLRFLRDVAD